MPVMATSEARWLPDLPAVTRAGWQCPECRTVYSPDVRQCDCAAVKRSLAKRAGGKVYESGPVPYRAVLPSCTCPAAWGGLCPPPACPAHGQTEMLQVRCR